MFLLEIYKCKINNITRGKSLDTFAPCGPWITSMEEIPDVENLQLTTRINGQVRQNSSTKNMFIKIPSIVSKLSKIMTLEKGDIIQQERQKA